MAKELLARGQATITTQSDAYTLTQSLGEYIYPATGDGRIIEAVTVSTDIRVSQGDQPVTGFTIGSINKPAGFSTITVDNLAKRVTFLVTAGTTTLADHGKVDIPVMVAGMIYRLSFVWSKAKAGAPGVPGTDANMLDWVKEWNTGKTQIDQSTVITPKLFAGVKNVDGTLTGTAIGRYTLTVKTASGTLTTETVDGISGFKEGHKTFSLDNSGSVQLGRADQYIKYNAATGKVEFGAGVSLQWAGATFIDKNGVFTGTLSAATVSAVRLDASQITAGKIGAQFIDVAALKTSLITAGNIEALTLNVIRGKIGGWSIDADSIFRGAKNNSSGAFTPASGAVSLGSNGLRGYKWRLEATGAGAIAGGNIAWDAAGNVVFAPAVSLLWSGPIGSVTAALGGDSYPKLTKISAQGIYTGSLTASQLTTGTLSADRIAAGSLKAEKLDAASIQASIINTEYINGLSCTFKQGVIGGWIIKSNSIISSSGNVVIDNYNKRIAVFASGASSVNGARVMLYYASDTTYGLCVTDSSNAQLVSLGSTNQISGWKISQTTLSKNSVYLGSDGSIYNGNKWKLNNDGSGQLAAGNISWNAAGAVTFASSVSLNWTTPINNITEALGGTSFPKLTRITSEGIYTGNLSAQQITTGTLSAARLDAAGIKASIINTGYISGLSCDFTKGTIGGWNISTGDINAAVHGKNGAITDLSLRSEFSFSELSWFYEDYPAVGLCIRWRNDFTSGHLAFGEIADTSGLSKEGYMGLQMMDWDGNEYFCLSAPSDYTGEIEPYNRIAGWAFDQSRIWKNNISLGGDGSISNGVKWQLNNDGSGRIASGNISWDASGNVTFASQVSVAWTAGVNAITAALGGASYPKLTKITSTGIYTGTISAGQINVDSELVVGGSTHDGSISVQDATNRVRVTLDRNGITAIGGKIGGWIINNGSITAATPTSGHRITLSSTGYLYNDNPATAKDYWGLKSDGSATFGYGTISFAQDGSGFLANQNVKWDTAGNVTLKGIITATGGKIAGFTVSGNKLVNTASDSSIEFSSMIGNASLYINSSNSLISMRADSARTGINIQTYATGAVGIHIIANAGSKYAIESYGPTQLGQRSSEKWNVPGVLYIGSKYSTGYNSYYKKIWGEGVTISSFSHIGSGQYKVYHNLNHTNYTVLAIQWASGGYHGSYRLVERAATYFVIQNMSSDGSSDSAAFDFVIMGRNTW